MKILSTIAGLALLIFAIGCSGGSEMKPEDSMEGYLKEAQKNNPNPGGEPWKPKNSQGTKADKNGQPPASGGTG